jgi:capsular polysaccharide transport system permease protein
VIVPVAVAAWYLYTRAADQFASTVGFSVRSEEGPNATDLLGGMIGNISSGSSSDTDVISAFIESQDLVERVDARLDLRAIYTRPEGDPVFTLEDGASIEDLVTYWNRMVTVYYDSGQGLIELRVLAFDPQDAQDIARAVFDESAALINELTAIARADATRYARQDLEDAVERLKQARAELTAFRSREQIVDPTADIQGQMGLLNTLQAQLAEAMIDLDLLLETTREGDPRIRQTEQRIAVIEKRIREERAKFGIGGGGEDREAYATLVGEFESLMVDREFAEQSYLTALTALEAAQAEAERQTRYLAAHIRPTLAQSAEYPQRETILMVLALFAFAAWATAALIFYSVKDRR